MRPKIALVVVVLVVMETYLNIAPWGPVVGVEVASQYYFRKSAAELTRKEAILLATALPNPSVRNPAKPSARTLKIAKAVEKRMPMLAPRSECVVHWRRGGSTISTF
jgi:monofunctional glycosyltransferase